MSLHAHWLSTRTRRFPVLAAPPLLAAVLFCFSFIFSSLLPETAPHPLANQELAQLIRAARSRWADAVAAAASSTAAAPPEPVSAGGGVLAPICCDDAAAVCEDCIGQWCPNGVRLEAARREQMLSAWRQMLDAEQEGAGGSVGGDEQPLAGSVSWDLFHSTLATLYRAHKEVEGMLPPAAAAATAAGAGAGATTSSTSFSSALSSARQLLRDPNLPQVTR